MGGRAESGIVSGNTEQPAVDKISDSMAAMTGNLKIRGICLSLADLLMLKRLAG